MVICEAHTVLIQVFLQEVPALGGREELLCGIEAVNPDIYLDL